MDREFYKHENYNLDNLYKNRLHEAQPAEKKNESSMKRFKAMGAQKRRRNDFK